MKQDDRKNISPINEFKNRLFLFKYLGKILRNFSKIDKKDFKEELLTILETAKGTKKIGEIERQIMVNAVSFSNLTVEDIMVHRSDIIAIDNKINLNDLQKIVTESKHTRFPVYEEKLDNIIGFIHIKDLMKTISQDEVNLSKILRPISSVTLNLPLPNLLVKMRAAGAHMAVVIDEYGGVDGIVAFEDIIEEIIGKVYDEHDKELEPEYIIITPNKIIKAKARLSLEDLEKLFDIKFTEEVLENIDTVAGLIFSIEGRIPVEKEIISYEKMLKFEIIEADNRSIKWVKIYKIPDSEY